MWQCKHSRRRRRRRLAHYFAIPSDTDSDVGWAALRRGRRHYRTTKTTTPSCAHIYFITFSDYLCKRSARFVLIAPGGREWHKMKMMTV